MKEYGIMEYLELTVTRCGRWMGNREFIWSGLNREAKRNLVEAAGGKFLPLVVNNFGHHLA